MSEDEGRQERRPCSGLRGTPSVTGKIRLFNCGLFQSLIVFLLSSIILVNEAIMRTLILRGSLTLPDLPSLTKCASSCCSVLPSGQSFPRQICPFPYSLLSRSTETLHAKCTTMGAKYRMFFLEES